MPVVKGDGSIRICGDFKRTINKAAKTKIYPLPWIEELFACLSGGQTFTTLDLSHAYLQLELEEESQELPSNYQHPQRPIQVYMSSIQDGLCPSYFPMNNGISAAGVTHGVCLYS